jgi:hypothetical protein
MVHLGYMEYMSQMDKMKQNEITKRIDFACLLERLQKKLNIVIDSDIVSKIYDIYDGTYENYTLLELINKLLENNIRITCPWNKKMIIEMIKTEGLYIPRKYEPMEPTNWELKISTDCCLKCNNCITISNHDIIQSSYGNVYEIIIVQNKDDDDDDKVCIFLFNLNNDQEGCFYPKTLVNILDYEDITIITNKDKGMYDGPYGNYTLIELIYILKEKNIVINCLWNKNAIIDMIKTDEQKFDIPKKYEPLQPSTWKYDRHRITADSFRYDYLTVTSNSYGALFEFTEYDLIRLSDGKIYEIEITKEIEYQHVIGKDSDIYVEIIYVFMYCIDTAEKKCFFADEFVKMLDYEDVTIIRNKGAKYNLY